jgi:hypothetical protein
VKRHDERLWRIVFGILGLTLMMLFYYGFLRP